MSLNMANIIEEDKTWELQLKSEVFEFIKSTFTLEVYEDHLILDGFDDEFNGDYNSFMYNNELCVDALDKDEITFYYSLYKNIKNRKINILSTEFNYDVTMAFTFYFTINGEFIIY